MNKNWIRLLTLAIISAMLLSLFACGETTETESESSENSEATTAETTAKVSETEESVKDPETESNSSSGSSEVTEESLTAESQSSETETSSSDTESSGSELVSTESAESSDSETEGKNDETDGKNDETDGKNDETTEKEEVTVLEKVYGYNFEDNSWTSLFDMAGSATRSIVADPAGSDNLVLAVVHGAGQNASYIRNKTDFESASTGKLTVSVDLYVPSEAFSDAAGYVQMMINGDPNHHCDLVSDAKGTLGAFDTQDFPRDKWFKVQFIFDMDNLKYDVVIVEDGQVRTEKFIGRGFSNLSGGVPKNLRVFVGGADHTVYVDHLGVVTTRVVVGGGEQPPEEEVASDVKFLRIDGINAAGEKLSVYGDFAGKATAADLTELVWERSDSYNGTYTTISGVNSTEYTPENGGYYLRVRAKYGVKSLKSYPIYVQEKANNSFYHSYASIDGSNLSAAIVYNNEHATMEAELKAVIHYSDYSRFSYINTFDIKQGSDLGIFTFDVGDKTVTKVELTVTSGNTTLCEAALSEGLPTATFKKDSSGSSVFLDSQLIAHFKNNRYMRFRSTTKNDHWIGTEHNPIDMGFAYQETGVAGLANTSVNFSAAPGAFKIMFTGKKAGLNTEQTNELIGFWNADKQEFTYIYNCSMTADTKSWHNNSSWAGQGRIEPFDYHLERMSILDRVYNNNQNGDLYDYVIYENGSELVRIPKLPVPRTAISGKYFYGFFLSPGESVYYPDPTEGGWKSTVLSDSGDTYVEICWSWYDIHSCSENSVPMLGSCDKFTVSQSWLFDTTTAAHDTALINDAKEVDWKNLPNYQLPLFSTNNTFETQFGGTNWQYAWWKSTYDCTMDAEVGHNSAGSVKIEKSYGGEASWYTEGVWGFPYSFDDVRGKTYRVSGYIKTENVVGEAYIANIQYQHATPGDNTVHKSAVVSGTTDWTYVTFTFTAQQRQKADGTTQSCIDHFFLTLNGTGTVWFDDVVIEEVIE